jgi:hypothetical protein
MPAGGSAGALAGEVGSYARGNATDAVGIVRCTSLDFADPVRPRA